jgi:hypothetical protein
MRHIAVSRNDFQPFNRLYVPDDVVQIRRSIFFHPASTTFGNGYHGNSYPALAAESCAAFAFPVAAVDDSALAAII